MNETVFLIERADVDALLDNEDLTWRRITEEIRQIGERFGPRTDLGRRRTLISEARAQPPRRFTRKRRRSRSPYSAPRRAGCAPCPTISPILDATLQGRGPVPLLPARAIHRPLTDLRRERQVLHTDLRPSADRPRLRRATAADH